MKKLKKQKPDFINPSAMKTKYNYAFFRTDETKQLQMPYGNILIPPNQQIFAPVTLQVQKKQLATIEDQFKVVNANSNLNNEMVLVVRYGGIGDIIAVLFSILELRRKFPMVKIGFLASPSYSSIIQCFPGLVDIIFQPITAASEVKKFRYIVYLDNTIESHESAQEKTLHDIYSEYFKVQLTKNTLNDIVGCNNVKQESSQRNGVGIQYFTNASVRNYSLDNFIAVINSIHQDYPQKPVYLLGRPDDYPFINYIQSKVKGPIIANGCGYNTLQLPNITSLVSSLEVVIGPDSSMLHIAGVCNTPMIGLFGSFPSKLRISHYNNAIGIDGFTSCSPCFKHFPTEFCTYSGNYPICINSIEPQLVVEQAKPFLK